MIYILLIVFLIVFCMSVIVRLIVFNPFATVYYCITDCIKYFKYKKWNVLKTGYLIGYTALFGGGKTLSVVHYIVNLYERYNNKKVWCPYRKKWVTQKVYVISNVELSTIPYEKFVSLEQVVRVSEQFKIIDDMNDTLTCTLVLGDEFSVQMNSRTFKSNIDPLFLNTLLTCRHHHITLVYDAQRFNHVDALLRQVTSYVVECKKIWRFQIHEYFDAYELERATDPSLVRPIRRTGFFVRDKDYHAYDTLACVGNLKKLVEIGDMMSEDEILSLQCNTGADLEGVTPSRKFSRLINKRKG